MVQTLPQRSVHVAVGAPSRPKVLFVGINYRYLNPTGSLLPAAVSRGCDVRFFGPGYVSEGVLAGGVAAYADSLGDIDLIVATKDVLGEQDVGRLNRFLSAYTVSTAPVRVSQQVLEEIERFLRRNRERVVLSLLDVDIYAIFRETLEHYLACARYFIGWGEGGVDFSGRDGDIGREPYIKRKRAKGLELGLYEQFVRAHSANMVKVGFFVGDHEFAWGGIATRPIDVSVPGVKYHRRRRAAEILAASKRFTVGSERFRLPFQVADRLKLRPFAGFYAAQFYNLAFNRLLARSKVCVTDGGLINFTIRKFFEIPAAGAILACWPTGEFERLGFENGVNCIYLREEHDVLDVVTAVVEDPDRFQAIAAAGRELVLRRHSTAARGEQIRAGFDEFLARTSPL